MVGYGDSGECPAEAVAPGNHVRNGLNFWPPMGAHRGSSLTETPAPDSPRRQEHAGGLGFAKTIRLLVRYNRFSKRPKLKLKGMAVPVYLRRLMANH